MLKYICDICGTEFKARLSINREIEVGVGEERAMVPNPEAPCPVCRKKIQDAEQKVIEDIKNEKLKPMKNSG